MKARHEFREEAILQWMKQTNSTPAAANNKEYADEIEAKIDELYYAHLRDYAAVHLEVAMFSRPSTKILESRASKAAYNLITELKG